MRVRRLWIARSGDGTPGLPLGRLVCFSFVTSGHFKEAHRSLSSVLVSFTRVFFLSLSSSCWAWNCLRKKIRRGRGRGEKKRR
jgi:hypothetical protein